MQELPDRVLPSNFDSFANRMNIKELHSSNLDNNPADRQLRNLIDLNLRQSASRFNDTIGSQSTEPISSNPFPALTMFNPTFEQTVATLPKANLPHFKLENLLWHKLAVKDPSALDMASHNSRLGHLEPSIQDTKATLGRQESTDEVIKPSFLTL